MFPHELTAQSRASLGTRRKQLRYCAVCEEVLGGKSDSGKGLEHEGASPRVGRMKVPQQASPSPLLTTGRTRPVWSLEEEEVTNRGAILKALESAD